MPVSAAGQVCAAEQPVSHRLLQWSWHHPSFSSGVQGVLRALRAHTAGVSNGLRGKKNMPSERLSLHLVLGLTTSTEIRDLHLKIF